MLYFSIRKKGKLILKKYYRVSIGTWAEYPEMNTPAYVNLTYDKGGISTQLKKDGPLINGTEVTCSI